MSRLGQLVVALAAGISLPSAAHTKDLHVRGTLDGAPAIIALEGQSGDYYSGHLQPGKAEVYVITSDPSGKRLLARGSGGAERIHFVAATDAPQLEVVGVQGTDFEIVLTRRTPNGPQAAPTDDLHSPKLRQTLNALQAGADTEAFWAGVSAIGTPLIEKVDGRHLMTFLYRGAANNVRLLGGPSSDHDWLARLGTSDIWYKTYEVPEGTRLSYRLAPDVPRFDGNPRDQRVAILATAAADPLNRLPWPETASNRWQQWSTVALDNAPMQPGFPLVGSETPDLTSEIFASEILGNRREITYFHTENFRPDAKEAVLLFMFDGPRAISEMQIPQMLDRLAASQTIPPVAAVFIDPIDVSHRGAELPGNPKFSAFLAQELLPRALQQFGMEPDRDRIVLAGASYGGIGATNAALDQPQAFGNVISLSGSYWWAPEGVTSDNGLSYVANRLIAKTPSQDIRFFIGAGRFETSTTGHFEIRETSRQLHAVLKAKGLESHWREYDGGHDSFVWRGGYGDGLIALFGSRAD